MKPLHLSPARLKALISAFAPKRILVVGDVMLDEFVRGRVSRISPEAPVPVLEMEKEELFPGGAANVARNLSALGAQASLVARIGKDKAGTQLLECLRADGVETRGVMAFADTPTTLKTRIVAMQQQIVRVDRESRIPLTKSQFKTISKRLMEAVNQADAVILEDYGKGFVIQEMADQVGCICAEQRKILAVDPHPTNPLRWTGATVVKPNRSEAFAEAGMQTSDRPEDLARVGERLLKKWGSQQVLVTLGEQGMRLFQAGEKEYASPTKARAVFDVSGAGDTSIAAFTLALCAGATPAEATEISNHAAGVVVAKAGTATVSLEELEESFRRG